MKTEIFKEYKSGFLISEQEYRRTVQACHEAAEKMDPTKSYMTSFHAKLSGGSILETQSLDEIFAIENSGPRTINELSVAVQPPLPNKDWSINISFLNGKTNPKSWVSCYEIIGNSRDWAFLAASDLDDRIKRNKLFPLEAVAASKFMVPLALVVSMLIATFVMPMVNQTAESHIYLQREVDAKRITDPLQAIIALEKFKNEHKPAFAWIFVLSMGIPILLLISVPLLAGTVAPAYNFYWGDYVARYDRLRQRRNVIWTVIVLGLLVSIASAVITRRIGI